MASKRGTRNSNKAGYVANPEAMSVQVQLPVLDTKADYPCLICPNKTFATAQALCDHTTMAHGGIIMSLLSALERVMFTYVFNPSFYMNFVWSIFSWAFRNPRCSSTSACSIGSCTWLIYTVALVFYPSIAVDGSFIGLSWAEVSRSQNHIQNNQLTPPNYKVLYGAFPIVDIDRSWFQLGNCAQATLDDDITNALCAESIDVEIVKIKKINNMRAKMLNGKWHQLSFTDEHTGSYVWGIPVPQSNAYFSFSTSQLKALKQILMPRWDLVAPTKDKLKELDSAFESSWMSMFNRWFFPQDIIKGYLQLITYQPWDQGNTVSVHNTHKMIQFIDDVWIPFCKWVILNRYDFFVQIRYAHFKVASIGTSWGAFIDGVFLVYKKRGKQGLTNEIIWKRMLRKFTKGKVKVKVEQQTYPKGGSQALCLLLGTAYQNWHTRCLKGAVMTMGDASAKDGIGFSEFSKIMAKVRDHPDVLSPDFSIDDYIRDQQETQQSVVQPQEASVTDEGEEEDEIDDDKQDKDDM